MFLNASVKDFSYFLGSVGAFGDHFGGNFGVIFEPGAPKGTKIEFSAETNPMEQLSGYPFGDQNPQKSDPGRSGPHF